MFFLGTVIFSIHQPRYSIFKLFDNVLFLSAGHIIYSGRPRDVLPYFASQGFQCEEHENPADFVLDVLIESNGRSSKLLQTAYGHSSMHSNIISLIDSITNDNETEEVSSLNQIVLRSRTSEFYYLAQRSFRNAIRNPAVAASQTIIAITLALLTGLLFNNLKVTIEPGVSNRLGAIFFLATHQIMTTASALEPLIKERALFSHVR
jgi:ATP-binding cassette subfamily G (WHITE) protein 2